VLGLGLRVQCVPILGGWERVWGGRGGGLGKEGVGVGIGSWGGRGAVVVAWTDGSRLSVEFDKSA
jgi:hypothetical protein